MGIGLNKQSYPLKTGKKQSSGIIYFSENGEEKKLEKNQKLSSENLRVYVGQTRLDESGFYSKKFYIGLIKEFLKLISKDGVLHIEVCSKVGEILNNQNDEKAIILAENTINDNINFDEVDFGDGNMSEESQIEFIQNIVNENFSKDLSRIKIVGLSSHHGKLLEDIQTRGVENLGIASSINLNDGCDSQKITALLYDVFNNDRKFRQDILNTIPNNLRKNGNKNSQYYGIVEVAIRLMDYINGINIQAGERRQENYDCIIRKIIFGEYNNIFGIKKIYDYLKKNGINDIFNTLHFSKNLYEQEEGRKKRILQISKYVAGVSLAVMSVLSTVPMTISGYEESKGKLRKELLDSIKKEYASKVGTIVDMTDFRPYGIKYETIEGKKNFLEWQSKGLANTFLSIYGENVDFEIVKLENLFYNELIKSKEFLKRENVFAYISWYMKFINQVFIPNNEYFLNSVGFNLKNGLGKFSDYIEEFEKTISISSSQIENVKIIQDEVYDIGYIEGPYGKIYLGIINVYIGENKMKLIVSKSYLEGDYSLLSGRSIANDLLKLL